MREQTKVALEHANGRRVPCGLCDGTGVANTRGGRPVRCRCERCEGLGTVLWPLRYFADRLTA